ncbi:centrosome-associated protein Alms1a-like [Calliphora vicina]|uniref:centrosome-associated protein Alms1a-like n=1 Tax=Calliphora vicina TaxID=7373 RepID=UPI00325AE118
MDNQSQHSKRVLPNTPRVSDKIMEYYQLFGHDRDLEKFMRLYSPANSQDSQKTQAGECGATLDSCCKSSKSRESIPSTSSCEALAMMPSRPLSVCAVANSKSLPNIDVQGQDIRNGVYFASNDVIVDINIETEGEKEKILSISTENLETPKKTFKNIKTQTPESVAKTHRRLEWDSLGDVGYKKSMSTSNISVMERSLLREFFKENSVVSEPGTSAATVQKIKPIETVEKLKATEIEHSTPPLACSTLVETTKRGAKPKMISQSTSSTSLNEKFEKYAQTSLIKPTTVHSQEIQCTMSSTNSIIEGTATPSSFEYYSSRSSKSGSSKANDYFSNANVQTQNNPLEHPFITSITDLLMKRKALGEKNQQKRHQFNSIRELQTKFQAAIDENKENQSHSTIDSTTTVTSFSLSKQAPELDLGIQLICSLIDAKSVNGRQKKQLIRDIVKRITRLDPNDQTSNSTTINSSSATTINSSDSNRRQIYDSVRSNISNRHKQVNMAKLKASTELGLSPLTAEKVSTEKPSTSSSSTNENSNTVSSCLVAKQSKDNVKSKPLYTPESHSQLHQDKGHYKNLPYNSKNECENALKENNTKVSSAAAAATINKETQSELIMMPRSKDRSKQKTSNLKQMPEAHQIKHSTTSIENKTNRSTQTSKTATTTSSTTSVTTTPDMTTQKFIAASNNELNNSNTDADQPTMREWLNPLTQSEIEYEERKRQELKKNTATQREKLIIKSKNDSGRVKQLNWIENEINRLECLKHLLLKDETTDRSLPTEYSDSQNLTKNSTQTDKLYDTVCSDKSSVLSESAERLVQEIEFILEESHEDVINLKDNLKRTKDRKKETQIIYEKDLDSSKKNCPKTKPKFRTLKESINISEEQLLNVKDADIKNKQRKQREKIDTPSTEKSLESESLRDLVQQRKRDFMAAYKTKKQHHYEALKQQQKEDFKYLNIQRQMNEKLATTTDSEHYSVPHTLPRKYITNDVHYTYTQHPLPLIPTENGVPKRQPVMYSTTAMRQQQTKPHMQATKLNNTEMINTIAANTNTTTTSSSSLFCLSSDVSVPMGSQNTSSTPTTTHQYDDVATAAVLVGVAVQTSDSIMRSKPIYGPKRVSPTLKPYNVSSSSTTACVQVKPKGIAYVIEFSDNNKPASNSTSITDINSNDLRTTSNATNEVANNFKALLPTEPQLTLQEHLEKSKPKFMQQSKERKAILNQLQSMRQERDRQLREIIDNTSFNSLDRRLQYLPPPPIQKVRILNTKEMKALTNKRFSSLPEVVARQKRDLEEKKRRSNRILRDIFNRRLQKRVRSGKLSLNHSKTVI